MAHIDVEKTDLTYLSTDTINVTVTDDNGGAVDLTVLNTNFGISVARNNHYQTPLIIQKILGGDSIGIDNSQDNRAIITFNPDDYTDESGNAQLYPRLFGYWYTIWYRAPGDTDRAVITGPLTVYATVPINFI